MVQKSELPFMFRGSSRIYRVIGVQGDTVFGLNVNVCTDSESFIELVFACLGKVGEGSPFTVRDPKAKFLVAFDDKPSGNCPISGGQRLDKIRIPTGKNLDSFTHMAHLSTQVPALKEWLDKTLEDAGVMPAYNDASEIFGFFFGKSDNVPEPISLELKSLGEYKMDEIQGLNYSQYGKVQPHAEDDESSEDDGEL